MDCGVLSEAQLKEGIEVFRKKKQTNNTIGKFLLFGFLFLAFISFVSNGGTISTDSEYFGVVIFGVVLGIAGVVFLVIGQGHGNSLKRFISENIISGVLSEFFKVDAFEIHRHIPGNVISKVGMIPGWDKAYGSDYVAGTYKGLSIQFSDVELKSVEVTTDDEGHRTERESRVFLGPWLVCDFGIDLPANLMVRENSRKLMGSGYQKDGNDLDTENEAFNARYEIRAGDAHTAFYILTPHFMEKIQEINDRAGGRLFMCFFGREVHIAVHNNRDSFEVGGKAEEFGDLDVLRDKFRSQIRYLTDIIDELMLNDKLYKGEGK